MLPNYQARSPFVLKHTTSYIDNNNYYNNNNNNNNNNN